MHDSDNTAPTLSEVTALADRIRQSVARVIVGKERAIDYVLVALLSEGHILLDDVPGLGKTMLAKSLASAVQTT